MKHPAYNYSFNELLAGLEEEVKANRVKRVDHNGLSLFNYKIVDSKHEWSDFLRSARGLILSIPDKKIVALPFPKFFNYGEEKCDLPNLPFTTSEKLDGTLGILYYWKGQWRISTRGSFHNWHIEWGQEYLDRNIDKKHLNEDYTYLVEMIISNNRIVVPYDFEGMVLLSAYSKKDGYEIGGEVLDDLVTKLTAFHRPYFYNHKIDDLLSLSKTLSLNQEGFVVRFSNGYRIKIKGDEYCRVHRAISNVTPLAVWRLLLNNDNIEEVRKQLPEEYLKDFDLIVLLLNGKFNFQLHELKKDYEKTKHLADKDLGIRIKSFNPISQKFLFRARKHNFFEKVYGVGKFREDFFKTFRPKNNILKGYTPCGAVNRFHESS